MVPVNSLILADIQKGRDQLVQIVHGPKPKNEKENRKTRNTVSYWKARIRMNLEEFDYPGFDGDNW